MRKKIQRISFIVAVGCTLGVLAGFGMVQPYGVIVTGLMLLGWVVFACSSVTRIA